MFEFLKKEKNNYFLNLFLKKSSLKQLKIFFLIEIINLNHSNLIKYYLFITIEGLYETERGCAKKDCPING